MARVALIIGLALTIILATINMANLFYAHELPSRPSVPHTAGYLGELMLAGVVACLGAGAWAMLTCASTLAAQIPEPRLVWHSKFVARSLAFCYALLCVFQAVIGFERVGPVMGLVNLAVLFLCLWTVALMIWYGIRFREALTMSQQSTPGRGR
jgi:hypothetical protein